MLIQNPDSYLRQKADSTSAIVMRNATFSWTESEKTSGLPPGTANGVSEHKPEETEALPALRNISFTLPKVCFTSDDHT